jgi:hypothetical protein
MHAKILLMWCFCICQDSWCDGCRTCGAQHVSLGRAPQEFYFSLFRGRHQLHTQSWRTLLFSKPKKLKLNFFYMNNTTVLVNETKNTSLWNISRESQPMNKTGAAAYSGGCIYVHAFHCVMFYYTYNGYTYIYMTLYDASGGCSAHGTKCDGWSRCK